MTFTDFLADDAAVLDAVADGAEEVVVTRPGREPVVIVPLAEYESLKETLHLLGSPANARRLLDAIEQLESGHAVAHDLIDAD
jgi:antitoxin YefM